VKKAQIPPYILPCLKALQAQNHTARSERERIKHYMTNIAKGVDELVEEILNHNLPE